MRRAVITLGVIVLGTVTHAHSEIPERDLSQDDLVAVRSRAQANAPGATIESIHAFGPDERASWATVRFTPQERVPQYDVFLSIECARNGDKWTCEGPERNLAIRKDDKTWDVRIADGVAPDEGWRVFGTCWSLASTRVGVISRWPNGFRWFGSGLEYPLPWEGTAVLEPEPVCERIDK